MDSVKLDLAIRSVRSLLSGKCSLGSVSVALHNLSDSDLGLISTACRISIDRLRQIQAFGQLDLPSTKASR